jgi:hypothetical protein
MSNRTLQDERLRNRKHSDPFARPVTCKRRGKAIGSRRSFGGTQGGETLERRLMLAELRREVSQLKSLVKTLMKAVDPEDILAVIQLQKSSPSNAQLRVWAQECVPPDDLMEIQEEKPW